MKKTGSKKSKHAGEIAIEQIIYIALAIFLLAIIIIFSGIFKSKGINAIDYIKRLFKFG